MSNLTEVSEIKLQFIEMYHQGCLDGLVWLDSEKFTLTELYEIAKQLTKKHFYHYPIYQVELEYFLQKFNA
jgi:hypothetical protein